MNLAQYPIGLSGGVLCSDPQVITAGDQDIVLYHALDRPPDIAWLRLTNIVADQGWKPGESFMAMPPQSTQPNIYIEMKAGVVTGHIWGSSLTIPSQTSNTSAVLTVTSWKVELVCVWFAPLLPSL